MPRKPNYPEIRGFEFFPEGKLLNQKVDFSTHIGIAYERCIGYTKPKHSHDRITITFPRGSSQSFIKTFPDEKDYKLNQNLVHVMSQDHEHEQGTRSTIYDTFALFVDQDVYGEFLKKIGAPKAATQTFLKTTQAFKKSTLLDEAVQRYFFTRVLQNENDHERKYLEDVILTELFTIVGKVSSPLKEPAGKIDSNETGLLRAVEYIETNLFEKIDVNVLVEASRTSQATLFRQFKQELKVSPVEYIRNRRMDEAKTLLKSGLYQVSDVALLVGYQEIGSFTKAFKSRFGSTPSDSISK